MTIAENVALVRENMDRAARAAGRDPKEILLLAATKMNDADRVRQAIAAGVDLCGENRVQEMLEKQAQGAYAGVPLGADSLELLSLISRVAQAKGLTQDVLLEVNIGGESAKSGFAPEEVPEALARAAALPALRVRGLMAIPPVCAAPEENRPFFLRMQQLFIDNSEKKYDNIRMDFLSMGMSGDYTEAIACGANLVRVGSGIFGPRQY